MSVYQHYTVRELWEMVAHENPAEHAEALRGWDAKRSMLGAQIGNLQRLRQDLADAWSPDGSPAARAYLDQIDQTITYIVGAHDAAGHARTTYLKVTDALIMAQKRIKPLLEAYDDPKAAWRAYLAKTPAGPMVSTLPDSWAPNVGMPDFATDMVQRQHREELDRQARFIMQDTDEKVAAATAQQIAMPQMKRYDAGASPLPPKRRSGGSSSSAAGPGLPQPVFNPPPPNPELIDAALRPAAPPLTFDPGPFLTGKPAPVLPPVLMPPLPSVPASIPPATVVPPPMPPTAGRTPGRLTPTNGLIEAPPAQTGTGRPARLPLGEHGVIGGPGTGSAGRSGAIGRPTRSAGRTTSQTSATERGAPAGERTPGGGWRDRSYEAYSQRRSGRQRHGDEQWQVEEGVAPVLEAPPIAPVGDVTPGVIGIDR